LFRTLADEGLVDTIELGVIPVLLGDGIPLVPPGRTINNLHLVEHTASPVGVVRLKYLVGAQS
jgi:dihydrofolate reductase